MNTLLTSEYATECTYVSPILYVREYAYSTLNVNMMDWCCLPVVFSNLPGELCLLHEQLRASRGRS